MYSVHNMSDEKQTLPYNIVYTASQSTQTLEEDEDDDVYSTPLPISRPSSGYFDTSSLRQRAPLLNPELLLKLQREARKRSTTPARRREIAALLALYLQPESPGSSPGDSDGEEAQGNSGARWVLGSVKPTLFFLEEMCFIPILTCYSTCSYTREAF